MANPENVERLIQYGILKRSRDGSLRCPNEDEMRQQAKNFLETMAGEPLPEGTDPIELLEELYPGFSKQREELLAQMLDEAQQ